MVASRGWSSSLKFFWQLLHRYFTRAKCIEVSVLISGYSCKWSHGIASFWHLFFKLIQQQFLNISSTIFNEKYPYLKRSNFPTEQIFSSRVEVSNESESTKTPSPKCPVRINSQVSKVNVSPVELLLITITVASGGYFSSCKFF